jgi:NADH-quinone oxidoreductase subunit N
VTSADLSSVLPELFLALAAMALLMLGVFRKADSDRGIMLLAAAATVAALLLVWLVPADGAASFDGLFVNDGFSRFMKVLALAGAAITIVMAVGFSLREGMDRFEFPVLLLLAALGMLMMISANDLIALYVGLELQSLSLYVVAAFRRDSVRSTEAGLKYFVLGALSSGMLLYGSSMVYGFAGTTGFEGLAAALGGASGQPSLGLVIGLVFVVAGLAFKISVVPFHMWTPDVYEGAPTAVTAFLAAAPKVAAMALFVRVLMGPFGGMVEQWQQIIVFVSIASMALGAFAAINQTNIKRLMAYSSIGHMGYALVGLAAGSASGVRGIAIYMAIYLFMNLGTFACILCMRQNGRLVERIDDLAGLSKTNPLMALALAIFMFSMAGIPPLAGFFGKLYVFLAAIESGLFTLAVIGVVASVVSAFYYVRIVKVMYFDEAEDTFDRPIGGEMWAVVLGSAALVALFIVAVDPVQTVAEAAAAALVPGAY